jgi:hypothetical protein
LYRFKSDPKYAEDHNGKKVIYVDITARVASANGAKKNFAMEVQTSGKFDATEYFKTTGQGYQNFASIVWRKVPLATTSSIHNLIVTFTQGKKTHRVGRSYQASVRANISMTHFFSSLCLCRTNQFVLDQCQVQ